VPLQNNYKYFVLLSIYRDIYFYPNLRIFYIVELN